MEGRKLNVRGELGPATEGSIMCVLAIDRFAEEEWEALCFPFVIGEPAAAVFMMTVTADDAHERTEEREQLFRITCCVSISLTVSMLKEDTSADAFR